MAEQFWGKTMVVATSNGGGETLIQGLLYFARLDKDLATAAFLEGRLTRGADWRAFRLDPPDSELKPEIIEGLTRSAAQFANALATNKLPEAIDLTVQEDKSFRMSRLARILDFYQIARESSALEDTIEIP